MKDQKVPHTDAGNGNPPPKDQTRKPVDPVETTEQDGEVSTTAFAGNGNPPPPDKP